ncbi:hypothetical protein ACGH2B_18620 [Streptomyces sp. BBFR2]|uniref:hypothetical protein n=1 Tax=Streptomyces sp. BBFR2 TaxID=3372854 RepID=UPI0037D9F530
MRRGLMHTGAWTLATGGAVALSWFGVHAVLSGTAYDPPRAVPLSAAAAPSSATAAPQASSTHRPKPSPTPTTASPSPTPSRPAPPARPEPSHRPSPPPTAVTLDGEGTVKSFTTSGGRVALDLRPDSAQLVSATPEAGWEMQVWKQDGLIRVDFTSGGGDRHATVLCTWDDGHSPVVQISESRQRSSSSSSSSSGSGPE